MDPGNHQPSGHQLPPRPNFPPGNHSANSYRGQESSFQNNDSYRHDREQDQGQRQGRGQGKEQGPGRGRGQGQGRNYFQSQYPESENHYPWDRHDNKGYNDNAQHNQVTHVRQQPHPNQPSFQNQTISFPRDLSNNVDVVDRFEYEKWRQNFSCLVPNCELPTFEKARNILEHNQHKRIGSEYQGDAHHTPVDVKRAKLDNPSGHECPKSSRCPTNSNSGEYGKNSTSPQNDSIESLDYRSKPNNTRYKNNYGRKNTSNKYHDAKRLNGHGRKNKDDWSVPRSEFHKYSTRSKKSSDSVESPKIIKSRNEDRQSHAEQQNTISPSAEYSGSAVSELYNLSRDKVDSNISSDAVSDEVNQIQPPTRKWDSLPGNIGDAAQIRGREVIANLLETSKQTHSTVNEDPYILTIIKSSPNPNRPKLSKLIRVNETKAPPGYIYVEQSTKCSARNYPICNSCRTSQCAFKGIRFLLYNKNDNTYSMEKPVILEPDNLVVKLSYPRLSTFNPPLPEEVIAQIKAAVAHVFLPLLERDIKRAENTKTIERQFYPESSFNCSYCLSILLTGVCCMKCGRNFCEECAGRILGASERHRARIEKMDDKSQSYDVAVKMEKNESKSSPTSGVKIAQEVTAEDSIISITKKEQDESMEVEKCLIGKKDADKTNEAINQTLSELKLTYNNVSSVSLPSFSKIKNSSPPSSTSSLTALSESPSSPVSPVLPPIKKEEIGILSKSTEVIKTEESNSETLQFIYPHSSHDGDESNKTLARVDERLCQCVRGDVLGHTPADLFSFTSFSAVYLKGMKENMKNFLSQQQSFIKDPAKASNFLQNFLQETTEDDFLPYLHVDMSRSIDEDFFRKVCAIGQTIVIHDTKKLFELDWDPNYFIQHYGSLKCKVQTKDDPNNAGKESTIKEFFSLFEKDDSTNKFFKLKDWPTDATFSEALPDLFEDFNQALPVPSIMGFGGPLNLASYFPKEANIPDLGPKLYAASKGVNEIGGKGSTTLHMDVASAMNIMTYTSAGEGEAGAVWDIYPAESSEKLRTYLDHYSFRKLQEEDPNFTWEEYQIIYDNQIHMQQIYIDEDMRKELAAEPYNVRSWRIFQKVGDAVYIPAGCAHQVCNLANCIKIAVDFIDMENLDRVVKLSNEFRQQTKYMSWKEDILQVRLLFFYVWNALTAGQ